MEPLIGEIKMFGGDFAPRGWLMCDGTLLSSNQYNALSMILGSTYGGDGFNNFAVPDLRGRVAIQPGQGINLANYERGQAGGAETVIINNQQMPPHSHLINSVSTGASQLTPAGGLPAASATFEDSKEVNSYSAAEPDGTMNPKAIASTGGGQPLCIMQPYLAINYIIAYEGMYPSRP